MYGGVVCRPDLLVGCALRGQLGLPLPQLQQLLLQGLSLGGRLHGRVQRGQVGLHLLRALLLQKGRLLLVARQQGRVPDPIQPGMESGYAANNA